MLLGAAAIALFGGAQAVAQTSISPPNNAGVTSPREAFPVEPGSDYYLANYSAYEAYLKKIATQSDRMKLVDIGKSAEGRTQWMAIVSSPENLAKMDQYRGIAQRLAKAEGLTDEQAHQLANEGKAVVWIDAGLHATEVITAQSQIHVLYRMLTYNDAETKRILDNVIILFGHDNPDGMQLVADWYMQKADEKKREYNYIPRLYQKYIGHDNNRDSFMAQMPETENVNRQLFRVWYPQIIFNQHQTGPAGMVVFVPPFRDPFNYNYDPLLVTELDEVGATIHSRLIGEGKPGSGMRSAANYSTWHNGMERSISYFHNSIGLLTEIIGGPTPQKIPLIPDTQLPKGDEPMPVAPGAWHQSQSLEYQWSMDRAVLDYAARNRERLLFNIYRMGANGIARGNRDSWTIEPNDIDALKEAAKARQAPSAASEPSYDPRQRNAVDPALYETVLHDPAKRDPRGYVIPLDAQRDLPTTITFLNTLIKTGVDVLRATQPFTAGGKTYPAGSFVVKTAQAYRPHVLDMFEPQNHPNNLEYPGGPPKAPYDITGYNLSYQMGIGYDRILEGFDGQFEKVPDLLTAPAGHVIGTGKAGWLLRHEANNNFILTNRLLKAGVKVAWLKEPTSAEGKQFGAGAVWVPASAAAQKIIATSTQQLGVDAYAVAARPSGAAMPLKPVRVGLVDQYGGVIPSGWIRWLLEQYEFPFKVVYPQELDAGKLNAKYDVLVFADETVPPSNDSPYRGRTPNQPKPEDIPAEFRSWLGVISDARTVPQLSAFAKAGGTIVTIGSANRLGPLLGAPVQPALVRMVNGKPAPLDTKEFYIPGALIRADVDPNQPLAYGVPDKVDMFFDHSQSFNIAAGSPTAKRVSWYSDAKPLRSGWAMGQEKLQGTTAIVDVDLGKGKLFVVGPEVTQRAQPYVTFKFLFNGLLYGPAEAAAR
ncbi:peptidase [Sphingomonas sp. XMGL2]|uniref:Peptidase n=2 Tax=Sphingomonas quercus TaxID=2842451 RepID=A0ABS6BD67_9SPHN|nr:M14 metallopeptidase family protein [Sphingomonas quercus]MBU3076261.1 peptidase [Sphingomonas quercus]